MLGHGGWRRRGSARLASARPCLRRAEPGSPCPPACLPPSLPAPRLPPPPAPAPFLPPRPPPQRRRGTAGCAARREAREARRRETAPTPGQERNRKQRCVGWGYSLPSPRFFLFPQSASEAGGLPPDSRAIPPVPLASRFSKREQNKLISSNYNYTAALGEPGWTHT